MSTGSGTIGEFPLLTAEQLTAVARRGTSHLTTAGEVLYRAGDRGYDFIVIGGGEVDLVRPAMPDAAEFRIGTWGPGRFLGELNLLTGQTAIATARVRTPGVVYRLAPDSDPEAYIAVDRAWMTQNTNYRLIDGRLRWQCPVCAKLSGSHSKGCGYE